MTRPTDMNQLMREVVELARMARRLARQGRNDVAVASTDHFEQGAATAYRNQNREQLENNLIAIRALIEELSAGTPKA